MQKKKKKVFKVKIILLYCIDVHIKEFVSSCSLQVCNHNVKMSLNNNVFVSNVSCSFPASRGL